MSFTKIVFILLLSNSAFIFAEEAPRALPVSITCEDIIKLSEGNVPVNVIISQIKATKSIFFLSNEDILKLKEAGVSDEVINFMIETGIEIPRAILVEPPLRIRYYYNYDPWYDYWWCDPWYDHWWWRHRHWHRHHGFGVVYEEVH